MKVIITNDSLDSLLSIQISTNGGQSYSTYSVSSLKDGLTFDCSPKDLKVICDVNTLKYIQVLADGEKASSSDIDLSNYLKIRDFYFDFYRNPYYGGKELSDEDYKKLSYQERDLYNHRDEYEYYCRFRGNSDFHFWSSSVLLEDDNNRRNINYYVSSETVSDDKDGNSGYYFAYSEAEGLDDGIINLVVESSQNYLDNDSFYTDARVHFIKHF